MAENGTLIRDLPTPGVAISDEDLVLMVVGGQTVRVTVAQLREALNCG